MKKILAILLLATMLLGIGLMSGCNKQNAVLAKDFVIPEGGYDGSKVTITFYHTMRNFFCKIKVMQAKELFNTRHIHIFPISLFA